MVCFALHSHLEKAQEECLPTSYIEGFYHSTKLVLACIGII